MTFLILVSYSQAQWKPAGDRILTTWGENLDVNNVLPEYPRPIMERSQWLNLNGFWNYKILEKGSHKPKNFDGEILVPFAIESALSGVGKPLGEKNELWYERKFTIPSSWKGKDILLHFGAVDWEATVYVNDILIGSHTGGYTPFSFNITKVLQKGENRLTIKVFDGTNTSYQPCGKQTNTPKGIWYTAVSGIWQTVWLEPVPENHIENLKILPNIDTKTLSVKANINNTDGLISVKLFDEGRLVSEAKAVNGQAVELALEEMKLWNPNTPFLYDLEISLIENGKLIDQVKSYAAMRKISTKKDKNGIKRIQLNNEDLFLMGTLDQGWWPDGLYTAPTDEALLYDIQKTKDLGFNMIRKHVKVEPQRWYAHCDRLGMLVWQDMPSGDIKGSDWNASNVFTEIDKKIRTDESAAQYRKEWKEIIDFLYSHPSIVMWIPFNESWGQFETVAISKWTKKYDPSRLLNPASGGNHFRVGDVTDLHHYPDPKLYLYDNERVYVLGEYGGIGLSINGHLWNNDKNWGYIDLADTKEVTTKYVDYANQLFELITKGFSSAVYTQTTDVEIEVNGLMTYDRKLLKVDEATVRAINQKLVNSLKK